MKFTDVNNVVNSYLLMEDKGVVRMICGSMIANYLPTPPSWIFLVGAPSGGKSVLLSALKHVTGIFELDDMTAQTFASGMRGQSQNSLLYQLPNNGTVLIKDYSTMLAKDKESRGAILSQMRKIFDGDYRKKFGNGEEVIWSGKMGMMAGVTPEIYNTEAMNSNAALGERYLYYHMDTPDRIDVGMLSTDKGMKSLESDKVMAETFGNYLNAHIQRCNDEQASGSFELPHIPESIRKEIVVLAEMATRARSVVPRDAYKGHQNMPVTLEMTPRFAKSLMVIALGLLVLHRYDDEPEELTEQDKSILFKIALDSIPLSRRHMLEALTLYASASENGLREQMSADATWVKLQVNDLNRLGLVNIVKSVGSGWTYHLKPEYRELFSKYKNLSMSKDTLDDNVNDLPPEFGNSNDTQNYIPF